MPGSARAAGAEMAAGGGRRSVEQQGGGAPAGPVKTRSLMLRRTMALPAANGAGGASQHVAAREPTWRAFETLP